VKAVLRWFVVLPAVSLLVLALAAIVAPIVAPHVGLSAHRNALPAPGRRIQIAQSPHPDRWLNVYEFGQADADTSIILVHGVPGSGQMMIPLAMALAQHGFRAFTYDRLGWVHSSARPAEELADPPHNAADLVALARALSVAHPVLLGYSYGGGVVQEVNRQAPELAVCNVLVASIGNGLPRRESSALSRVIFSRPVLAWMLSMTATAKAGSAATMRALFYPKHRIPESEWMIMLATLDRSIDAWVREGDERWTEFEGFAPETIVQPTLVIHGEDDVIVPREIADRLARDIPRAQAHFVAGMGHAAPLTHADEIAKVVTDFVDRCAQREVENHGSI
jgi:pimeloyl-ACP methyl ester carboxylesterase